MSRATNRKSVLDYGQKWQLIDKLQNGIAIGTNSRIRLVLSDGMRFAEYGEEYASGIGVFPIRVGRGLIAPVWDAFSLHDELMAIYEEENGDPYGDTELMLKTWLTNRGYYSEELELNGYSQSDWATVLIYDRLPITDKKRELIRQVWRGDLYDLIEEKRKVYTSTDGDTIEVWSMDGWGFSNMPENQVWDGVLDTYWGELASWHGYRNIFGQYSRRGPIPIADGVTVETVITEELQTKVVLSGAAVETFSPIDTVTDGLALLILHADLATVNGARIHA